MLATLNGIVALLRSGDTPGTLAATVTSIVDDLLDSLIMPEAVRFFEVVSCAPDFVCGGFLP